MPALAAQRDDTARPVGVIEALGQISAMEVFVSGWSTAEITDGMPVMIVGDDCLVPGELTVIRADRPDVGPRTGFNGVVHARQSVEVVHINELHFANGQLLERYGQAITHGPEQCADILRAALAQRRVGATGGRALSVIAHRYAGRETVSASPLPVRMGIDDCVLMPGGVAFVRGWLVDPEHLCARVDLAAHDGATRIDETWLVQARPDVGTMLAADARLAGYDRQGDRFGFAAFAEIGDWSEDLHVALIVTDGPPLYVPLNPRRGDTGSLLRSILRGTDPDMPGVGRLIERLAPVLAATASTPPALVETDDAAPAPITLVLSCLGDLSEVMMTLTTLAADPELRDLPIVVAGRRDDIAAHTDRLRQHGRLLGVQIALASAINIDDYLDALLAGAAAAQSDLVCLVPPHAVPRQNGWIGEMLAELQRRPGAAVFASAALRNADARAVVELPAACLLDRSDVLEAIPEIASLSVAGKWDALTVGLRVAGIAVSEIAEPLFVAAQPTISPAERLMRRVDQAARKLRQW